MAYGYPSGSSTFIPSFEASHLVVSATRDPGQFKLARYMQYLPVDERVFYYLKLDLDEPARVVTTQEYQWAPGQTAPTEGNLGPFTFVQAATTKYAFPWILPDEAVEQAAWDIRASQMGIIQQKVMTARTIQVQTLLQTASNWPTTNTALANQLNGGAGKWQTASDDPASAYFLAIRKTIVAAMTASILYTNATMKWEDFMMVISPPMANLMGNTAEIYNYVKGSPDAQGRQMGNKTNGEFNAPPEYANVKLVVEDAVRVTTRPNVAAGFGATATRGWVWQDAQPVLTARRGGLVAQYGGNALATCQAYFYREAQVYSKSDPDNERQMGRVVDDYVVLLPFPQSGYLIQSAL